ncbi:MAG: HD-GYP domain-containing protein, partial [Candidatus Eremiobacterota bacterium]
AVTPGLAAPWVGASLWSRFRSSPWRLRLDSDETPAPKKKEELTSEEAQSLQGFPLPHMMSLHLIWLDTRLMFAFHARAVRYIASYAASLLRKAREKRRGLSEEEVLNYLLGLLATGGEFTQQHSVRVMKLSLEVCRELGLQDPEWLRQVGLSALLKDIGEAAFAVERAPRTYQIQLTQFLTGRDLFQAGLLHDLGKLRIRHEILYKPGALTQEEFAVIKMHPIYSEQILWPFPMFRHLCPMVRGHHERWDGKGYPDNLRGTDIPLGARIIALADVFDALYADRPYRAGMPLEKVCRIIREGSGTHFDPDLVEPFLRAVDKVEKLEGQAPTG